jgi:hypothetical protein
MYACDAFANRSIASPTVVAPGKIHGELAAEWTIGIRVPARATWIDHNIGPRWYEETFGSRWAKARVFGTILAVSTDSCDIRFYDGDEQALQLEEITPADHVRLARLPKKLKKWP